MRPLRKPKPQGFRRTGGAPGETYTFVKNQIRPEHLAKMLLSRNSYPTSPIRTRFRSVSRCRIRRRASAFGISVRVKTDLHKKTQDVFHQRCRARIALPVCGCRSCESDRTVPDLGLRPYSGWQPRANPRNFGTVNKAIYVIFCGGLKPFYMTLQNLKTRWVLRLLLAKTTFCQIRQSDDSQPALPAKGAFMRNHDPRQRTTLAFQHSIHRHGAQRASTEDLRVCRTANRRTERWA